MEAILLNPALLRRRLARLVRSGGAHPAPLRRDLRPALLQPDQGPPTEAPAHAAGARRFLSRGQGNHHSPHAYHPQERNRAAHEPRPHSLATPPLAHTKARQLRPTSERRQSTAERQVRSPIEKPDLGAGELSQEPVPRLFGR